MLRKRLPVLLVLLLATVAAAGSAVAGKGSKGKSTQVKFVGVHPIAKAHGGGICHIEAPHVHVYAPADVKVQYRVHDDHYYFVGDPVAYGWEGPKYTYYGHHPVNVDVVLGDRDDDHDHVEYCYLDGSHFHYYQPAAELKFEVRSDAYLYVGDVPDSYVSARAELDPIDVVYEPIVYERPVVVIEEPPPAWIGVRFAVVAPVVVVPVVEVERPRARGRVHADVEVVAPSLSIEIGVPSIVVGGGVFVESRGHGHYKHKHKKYKHKGKRHKRGKGRGHW